MRRRGRPPSTRGIYSLDELVVPPPEIVLETSFVAEALLPSQRRHIACRDFLANVAVASTAYVSELLETELWETAYAIACRELQPRKKRQVARLDGRTRRRAKRLQQEMQEAWHAARDAMTWAAVGVGEVGEWVPKMMTYGLASNDAVHAATAAYADVKPMATTDFHFSRVPAALLTLYVPAERVRPCRDERGQLRG